MSIQSPAGFQRFTARGLWTSLSLAIAAVVASGSLLRAKSDEFFTGTASVVVCRARPPMSRQPRPLSAPLRHLDQRIDSAVVLLGIEDVDDAADPAVAVLPMGEWIPRR